MWNNQGGYDQGGGYLNSPNVGGSQQQQQQQQQPKSNRQRAQSIMPCTIAQINKSEQTEDKFVIDGIELNQVVLVGLVRSSNETSTRLDYQIDDMTGAPLEVRQFVDNDENTPDAERTNLIRQNIYVRVHGHVRAFAGKRSVVAFRVTPLDDMNELTTHILEVIYAHAYLTKRQAEPMDTGVSQPTAGRPITAPNGHSTGPGASRSDSAVSGGGDGGGGGQLDIGLNPEQQQVLNIIRSSIEEHGMGIAMVSNRLKSMPQRVIKDAIEFLSSEGHIYSTIDDEHYKATDSC